jgi:hypothetical protein
VTPPPERVGPLTVPRLRAVSFSHSCIYLALLVCAFALGGPQPETFVLGWAHGLLWIGMSLVCLFAARKRLVSVAVLGGIGPFFGSYEFVREGRRRSPLAEPPGAPPSAAETGASARPLNGSPH